MGYSIVSQVVVLAIVVRLDVSRCPAYIARLVVAIVVYTVDAVLQAWTDANISSKFFKRVSPLLADNDSATSILGKSWVVWIMTPLQHQRPDAIQRRVGLAVSPRAADESIFPETATTLRVTRQQVGSANVTGLPAFTLTFPTTSVFSLNRANCDQSTESLTGMIFSFTHDSIIGNCAVANNVAYETVA